MEKKKCPFCGEEIAVKAKKCRFCGEWLDSSAAPQPENIAIANPQPPVQVQAQPQPVPPVQSPRPAPQPQYQSPQTAEGEYEEEIYEEVDDNPSFFNAYFVNPYIHRYADFKGYTTRKSFWLTYVATLILSVGLVGLILLLSSFGAGGTIVGSIISGLVGLALVVPGLALCARRLRDAGKNPWLILLGCIPVVGTIILLIFFCQESKYEDTEEEGHWQMPDWIVTGICVALLIVGIVLSTDSIGSGNRSYDLGGYEEVEEVASSDYDEEIPMDEEGYESEPFSTSQSGADSKKDWIVEFDGSIGNYPIKMYLNLKNIDDYDWCEVEGKYCYTSSAGSYLYISGVKRGDSLELSEYNDKGDVTGNFNGTLDIFGNLSSMEYTGTFTNYKGKEFKFSLRYN